MRNALEESSDESNESIVAFTFPWLFLGWLRSHRYKWTSFINKYKRNEEKKDEEKKRSIRERIFSFVPTKQINRYSCSFCLFVFSFERNR